LLNFRIGLTPDNNVWIGAWWIGFLAAAVICFIIAIPVLAFPGALPGIYNYCYIFLDIKQFGN